MSESNLAILPGIGRRDVDAMLQTARAANLQSVVIIGWDQDKKMFLSSSEDNWPAIVWLLENAKDFALAHNRP